MYTTPPDTATSQLVLYPGGQRQDQPMVELPASDDGIKPPVVVTTPGELQRSEECSVAMAPADDAGSGARHQVVAPVQAGDGFWMNYW